jgi:two-component system response regulator MtrA
VVEQLIPRVLVVEDDASVREATTMLLADSGLDVVGTATGEDALELVGDGAHFDLLILDLMLPGIDGFEVCRRLRARSNVAVLMLTARSELEDVVAGLELGADDYVVKPFENAELLARVRAAVRRQHMDPPVPRLRLGPLMVDPAAFRAELYGRRLELTAMEFRLLLELVRSPGHVLSREILLERVWGYDYLGDSRLVDMAVKRLRGKLGDTGRQSQFITTVRGVGYRFENLS